ncbi:MAG: ABC transporter permease [Sporolactobacillus sp.]|jgi:peptide/nickel transport system permease protein|nr:ABC transporter permease [Sporolactobacillus sp.]MCI1882439.1 ABC transporter permease [Sporolactobacillus sp.]
MIKYITNRLIYVIPVLIGVTIFVFLIIHLIPGDPARTVLGDVSTPQQLKQLRHQMGLDQPLILQYFEWVQKILSGNLGYSYTLHMNIANELLPKFWNSILLTIASLIIAVIAGVGLGFLSAIKKGSLFDQLFMGISALGASVPVFWIALMLMWIFALKFSIFPINGMINMRGNGGALDILYHLVLPAVATSSVSIAVIAQLTRNAVLDELKKDYVSYYRSFNISNFRIYIVHVFRNALPPIINIIGLQVGYLIGGALFSEIVFNWPGIGQAMYVAISSKDYPTIQAGILLISCGFVIVNLIVDIINILINPKLHEAVSG